jgi:antitoxin CcdA
MRMSNAQTVRKPVNLSIDVELMAKARALGVNVSKVSEAALGAELTRIQNERWREENREAMLAWNAWIEEKGLPLAEYRKF